MAEKQRNQLFNVKVGISEKEVFRPNLQIIEIYFVLLQKKSINLERFLYASNHQSVWLRLRP